MQPTNSFQQRLYQPHTHFFHFICFKCVPYAVVCPQPRNLSVSFSNDQDNNTLAEHPMAQILNNQIYFNDNVNNNNSNNKKNNKIIIIIII